MPFYGPAAAGGSLSADSVEAQHLANSSLSVGDKVNYSLAASVGSSALTITLNAADGSAGASDDPILLAFRSATAATGTETVRSVTGSTTLVVSSGSTLGASSGVAFRLWIVAVDDAGTIRLGVVNRNHAFGLYEGVLYSTTTEGGAGAADSAGVIYTGTGATSKAIKILGYMDWDSGLTTAGTWDAGPTRIQLFHAGIPMPGSVVQQVVATTNTSVAAAATIPLDDTIPQNTEGTEVMTGAITPRSVQNRLGIDFDGFFAANSQNVIVAMFQDATANALRATVATTPTTNTHVAIRLSHYMVAGTTSATTMKIRFGPSTGTAGACQFLQNSGSDVFSTVALGTLAITEYMA